MMTMTHTDWQDAPAAGAQEELLTVASTCPQTRHLSCMRWPVLLLWAALLLGGVALWVLAALGLGRLTGWW